MLQSSFVTDSFILLWRKGKEKKKEAHLTWGLYHSKSTVQFYNDSLLDSIALTFSPIIHPLKLGFWIKRLLESCSSFNHLVSAGLQIKQSFQGFFNLIFLLSTSFMSLLVFLCFQIMYSFFFSFFFFFRAVKDDHHSYVEQSRLWHSMTTENLPCDSNHIYLWALKKFKWETFHGSVNYSWVCYSLVGITFSTFRLIAQNSNVWASF